MHWFTNNFLNLGMSLLFPFCKARGMEMRWQCCPAEGSGLLFLRVFSCVLTVARDLDECLVLGSLPTFAAQENRSAPLACLQPFLSSQAFSPFFLFFFFGCAWDMSPARDQTHTALTDLLAGFAEGFAPPCDPGVSNHSSSTVPSPGGLQSAAPS